MNVTVNRGLAITQGVDLQLQASVTENIQFGLAVGYTDAYFPDATYGPPNGGVPSLVVGAGDKISTIIPWTVAANAQFSHDVSSLWTDSRAYLRIDYRWLDGFPKGDPDVVNYDPVFDSYRDPAYHMLNLRVGIVHERWDISAYVDNATNSDPKLGFTGTEAS